jgi:hypothetical protein
MEGYFFPHALTRDSSITKSRTFLSLAKRWSAAYGESATPREQIAAIMDDLREHADVYRYLRDGVQLDSVSGAYGESLAALSRMRCPSVVFPYIFSLHSAVSAEIVSAEDGASALRLIESFLFRRALVGLEPTGLHAVFKGLWAQVGADLAKLRKQLENKTVKFPNDEEFRIALESAPLFARKIRNFAMLELERSYTKGDVLKTFPAMTADHVLPQSPVGDWLYKFTSAEIGRWTDTWANLVPLSGKANSEKSNKSWAETKSNLKNETVFATTKHLLDRYDDWTPATLAIRAKEISSWALGRWPDVQVLL